MTNQMDNTALTISVIGYPGVCGDVRHHVGKSSLINRFMSNLKYSEDHLSVLSSTDFSSEVISSSHWLYWGENTVMLDDVLIKVRIIEHCEFVDDHRFLAICPPAPYYDRCLEPEIYVTTPKLAYICKEQLGRESSFPQNYLEPTLLYIDVFVCLYDITLVGPSASQQAMFLKHVLFRLSSSNFPLVLATTKHDSDISLEAVDLLHQALTNISKKRWMRHMFCTIETSARFDVNVDIVFQCAAFLVVCGNVEKNKLSTSHFNRTLKKSFQKRKPFAQMFKSSLSSNLHYFRYNKNSVLPKSLKSHLDDRVCHNCPSHNAFYRIDDPRSKGVPVKSEVLLSNRQSTNPIYSEAQQIGLVMSADLNPTVTSCAYSGVCGMQRLNILDSTNLKETCVLPTPPPLLLPGPRSSGIFGPISYPLFFETLKDEKCNSVHKCLLMNPVSDYSLARLYIYGNATTVGKITQILQKSCFSDRCHTKSGRLFRVWILVDSALHPHAEASSVLTMQRSESFGTRPNFLSIRPSYSSLTTSQLSAFSVPNSSSCGSSPEVLLGNSRAVSSTIIKENGLVVASSVQKAHITGESNFTSMKRSEELRLQVFVFSSETELSACPEAQNFINPTPSDRVNRTKNDRTIRFLVYFEPEIDNTKSKDICLSGLKAASGLGVPFLVADLNSSPFLLNCILDMGADLLDISNKCLFNSKIKSDDIFIDWTCLGIQNIPGFLPELIISTLHNIPDESNENNMKLTNILATLISLDRPYLNLFKQLRSRNVGNRLFSLPPTVSAPTAIRANPLAHQNLIGCLAPRFIFIDQVIDFVYNQSYSDFKLPNQLPYALIIHYSALSWSIYEVSIVDTIKKICNLKSDSSNYNIPYLILLVGIHTGSRSEQIPLEADGIHRGSMCINYLAQCFGCSVITQPSQSDILSVKFNKCTLNENTISTTTVENCRSSGFAVNSIFNTENTYPPYLGFLAVSTGDPEAMATYKQVLEGEFTCWYVNRSGTNLPKISNNRFSLQNSNSSPANFDYNITCPDNIDSTYSICNPSSKSQIFHPSNVVQSQINGQKSSPLISNCISNSGVIPLPWLPLSPCDAYRIKDQESHDPTDHQTMSTCDNHLNKEIGWLNTHSKSPVNLISWSKSHCFSPEVVCKHSVGPNNINYSSSCPLTDSTAVELSDVNSSVEEYYAELPKVIRHNTLESAPHRRYPNRPKRPRPCTSSTHSPSSSSPSPDPSYPKVLDPVIHQNKESCSKSIFDSGCFSQATEKHFPIYIEESANNDCLDDSSAVYAEVNDAVGDKFSPYPPYSSYLPTNHISYCTNIPSSICNYELPYPDRFKFVDLHQKHTLTPNLSSSRSVQISKAYDDNCCNGNEGHKTSGHTDSSESFVPNQLSVNHHGVNKPLSYNTHFQHLNPLRQSANHRDLNSKLSNLPLPPYANPVFPSPSSFTQSCSCFNPSTKNVLSSNSQHINSEGCISSVNCPTCPYYNPMQSIINNNYKLDIPITVDPFVHSNMGYIPSAHSSSPPPPTLPARDQKLSVPHISAPNPVNKLSTTSQTAHSNSFTFDFITTVLKKRVWFRNSTNRRKPKV